MPKIGDRVRVQKFRTLPEFDGVIVEVLGTNRFNVEDEKGHLWFRKSDECTFIGRDAEADE